MSNSASRSAIISAAFFNLSFHSSSLCCISPSASAFAFKMASCLSCSAVCNSTLCFLINRAISFLWDAISAACCDDASCFVCFAVDSISFWDCFSLFRSVSAARCISARDSLNRLLSASLDTINAASLS